MFSNVGAAGLFGDPLNFGSLLPHAGVERRLEIGVADLVESWRVERKPGRLEQGVLRRGPPAPLGRGLG